MKLDKSSAVVTGGASVWVGPPHACWPQRVRVAIFDLMRKGERWREIGGLFCKIDVTSEESVDAGFVAARAWPGACWSVVQNIGNAFKTAWKDRETGEFKHTRSTSSI